MKEAVGIKYILFDPCGNTTALITDPVAIDMRIKAAKAVMMKTGVEQVGFLVRRGGRSDPSNVGNLVDRLEMAGGEFCANAARCMAAWLYENGSDAILSFEVSGADNLITAAVKPHKSENVYDVPNDTPNSHFNDVPIDTPNNHFYDVPIDTPINHYYDVSIDMPLPLHGGIVKGLDETLGVYHIVSFEGITHVILWDVPPSRLDGVYAEQISARVKHILKGRGYGTACFGVMFCKKTADKPHGTIADLHAPTSNMTISMTPLVRVDAVDTLVWESSCGSGTVAAACALSHFGIPHDVPPEPGNPAEPQDKVITNPDNPVATRDKPATLNYDVEQPGGTLHTKIGVSDDGSIKSATLSGQVIITGGGQIRLHT